MANSDDLIHPFLAFPGVGPALSSGLHLLSAARPFAAAPPREPAKPEGAAGGYLAGVSHDPNDLAVQRWALVVPSGQRGEELASRVKQLVLHRAEQQGDEPHVYRVAPRMTAAEAEAFVRGAYWDEVSRDTGRLPRYLLLAGDAHEVSWELQQALARHGAFPGRIAFDRDEEYELYANKVVASEKERVPARQALYFAVRDGSAAVVKGLGGWLRPSFELVSNSASTNGALVTSLDLSPEVLTTPAALEAEAHAMVARAAALSGGLLVTLSHGAGLDKTASPERRAAEQGAMMIHRDLLLRPSDLSYGPFLPGGAWFYFACFSAGTPSQSVYRSWLAGLASQGYAGKGLVSQALACLPEPAAPFVAKLPKAALASPDGPLAVFGHVDLAWSWSFAPVSLASGQMLLESRHERFDALLLAVLSGRRFGAALGELAALGASVGQNLLALYGDTAPLGESGEPPAQNSASAIQRACLWLEQHDLHAFVLLGDPAARLPERAAPTFAQAATSALATAAAAGQVKPDKALLAAEEDILDCLANKRDPEEIAESLGRTPEELKALIDAYREAGRRAIDKLVRR